ncbi:MAG: DUF6051 family protein [Bacteroidales bacterium]|nr:DUF6051 family protein [Bacteroidales bacterium]
MDLAIRTQELKSIFSYNNKVELIEDKLEILPFTFSQKNGEKEVQVFQNSAPTTGFCSTRDSNIEENIDFQYNIFAPKGTHKSKKGILLLHGLNERSWEKYLPWAEKLCKNTGQPVILFPIAFHMNRTPGTWYNPRSIMPWLEKRKSEYTELCNSSFVNVALSSRLSDSPLRFYVSGRESLFNIVQLLNDIRNGEHPLFAEEATINVFGYSIGALLSQVLMLSNPENLFDNSKFFLFCGGSIFEKMNGSAREIMDKEAYDKIYKYYTTGFNFKEDYIEHAFQSMVNTCSYQQERETFFEKAKNKIKAITLKKDVVIPTIGAIEAFGKKTSNIILEETDFPFEYCHQNPFPLNKKIAPELLSRAFLSIFNSAAAFIG